MIVIVLGVSGSGKSTIAGMLSKASGMPYYDADDFHPQENIAKMARGEALTDNDRASWLQTLSENMPVWNEKGGAVLACSALKEKYRQVLQMHTRDVCWVFLSGSYELIRTRITGRKGHFMGADLLRSQFEALEVPEYGLHVDISKSPDEICERIISQCMGMNKSAFGVFGLGVMGRSISLNIAERGIALSVYNRPDAGEEQVVRDFLEENPYASRIQGFTDLGEFVQSLQIPRKILLMISAGPVVDKVLETLTPMLDEGDIVIDGGNSHYRDTSRRAAQLEEKGLVFLGAGISGGEEGARRGPSIMPGGDVAAYGKVAGVLESIAARNASGDICCRYLGPDGSGHYVKMVHNGIEYVEMQLLAELYAVLRGQLSNEAMADVFDQWNQGELSSYLLGITAHILKKRDGEGYLLDRILDIAGSKGTGSWSSKEALDLGMPCNMMTAAVFARYLSSFKEQRLRLSGGLSLAGRNLQLPDLEDLRDAYEFARLLNHHQGFELMRMASEEYGWNLDLSAIASTWTGGCIIKSALMESLQETFSAFDNLLESPTVRSLLWKQESAVAILLSHALQSRLALHAFSAAQHYWIDLTTKDLPASLIQAQRDYFGAHTYKRKDAPGGESFHTDWGS